MKSRNMKVNRDGLPILMEDGKVIEMGRFIMMEDGKVIEMNESILIDKAIVEGMKYVSKMTIGLSTGQLFMDNEYIDLRNKIIKDLIEEQSIKVRSKLEQQEKKVIKGNYKDGYKIHKEVLDRMYSRNKEESKDDFARINLDDSIVKCGDSYKLIDYKKVKEEIEKKQASKKVEEEIEKRQASKKVAKKKVAKKKVAKKKVAKKKVAKKKVAKKKVAKKKVAKKKSKNILSKNVKRE